MNESLVRKATFSEICRVMKHKDGPIRECMQSIIKLSLLLFPGLMCKELAAGMALEVGLANIDVKNVVDNTMDSIKSAFGKNETDYTARVQDAQIAHVLLVFAAYFDSVKMYLPDANNAFALSNKEKAQITKRSLESYETFLKKQVTEGVQDEGRVILDYSLAMPNPVEGLDTSMHKLRGFYELLNSRFLDFVDRLSYVESLRGDKQDQFYATIEKMPQMALQTYKDQYYALSALFPDFFVWATQREHEETLRAIDVGFAEISRRITNISEISSNSAACRALDALQRKYVSYIGGPVVSTKELPLGKHDVRLPSVEASFIPQNYRAVIYKDKLELEHTALGSVRKDIGRFLADILRSPELGIKPIIVLGDPGSGKTMLCHMLASRLLSGEYHVIVLHLRNLAADGEIYQQINQEIEKSLLGAMCDWKDIASSNLSKPILLIFDGYDELLQASGKTHSNYLEKIAQFQKDVEDTYGMTVRTMVTSRKVLIDKAKIPTGSTIVLLEEFDDDQIGCWCDIWNNYNADYFSANKLNHFSVNATGKAKGLARQPLLLLMLALFDSNGNALRQHQDLSITQLYNSLIRDFIEREKKKDPGFDQKADNVRREVVDQELERISIAALGMYNRNELYIRSCQLQRDLSVLSSVQENADLQDSDKIFGSFFFIHRSDAITGEENAPIVSSAYEFLHNTFGEFLTAYYIVAQLYSALNHHQNSNEQQSALGQDKWFACMSFSPIFHRPVVAKMILSWAPVYFADKGLSGDNTISAMRLLIDKEIPNILKGDSLPALSASCKKFISQDGYPTKDALSYLATYSVNLICLESLICDGMPLATLTAHDVHAWSKMRHLWRYSFSEDDLAEFASCFAVEDEENESVLKHRFSAVRDEMVVLDIPGRSKKLFGIHVSLDEELEYAALGMMLDYDYLTVLNGLRRQNIPRKGWLAVRNIVNQCDIFSSEIKPYTLSLLDDVFTHGLSERDGSTLFYGFALLKFLTDPNNTFLGDSFHEKEYTTPGWLCFAYHHFSGMIERKEFHTDKPLGLMILEILNQMPLDISGCETICRELFPYKFRRNQYTETELFYLARLGEKVIDTYLDSGEPIPCHVLDSYIISLADTFEMVCKMRTEPISEPILNAVLTTTQKLMKHYGDENAYHLLMIYRDNLQHGSGSVMPEQSPTSASILIHTLQLYHKDQNDGSRLAAELIPIILSSGICVREIFDCDPSSVYDLIRIMRLFSHELGSLVHPMLIDLVNERPEQLTYGMYKELCETSQELSWDDLYEAINQNLG